MLRGAALVLFYALLISCAEGASGTAEPQQYLTLSSCASDATARRQDGSPFYGDFECREKIWWAVTKVHHYTYGVEDAFDSTAASADTVTAYRLYRNSVFDSSAAIHVASFDSRERSPIGDYNKMNCEESAVLFENQPGVVTKYWCESVTHPRGVIR